MSSKIGHSVYRTFATEETTSLLKMHPFWSERRVLAGVVVPANIPESIGIMGWAKVMGERIDAQAFVVLQKQHEPKRAVKAADAFQKETGKPAIVRLIVGKMNPDELRQVRDDASKAGIQGFFVSQGCEHADPKRLSIEQALGILDEGYNALSLDKPLLACPVPLAKDSLNETEALELLVSRVISGASLLLLPAWHDPQESMPFLEKFEGALPPVVQTLCPIGKYKQWGDIKSCRASVSDSIIDSLNNAKREEAFSMASIRREVETLQTAYGSAPKSVPLVGAYLNLSLTADEDLEKVTGMITGLKV